MERRLAIAWAVAGTCTSAVATVSFAALIGSGFLGFGQDPTTAVAAADPVLVTEIQTVDSYVVVVPQSTTELAGDPAHTLGVATPPPEPAGAPGVRNSTPRRGKSHPSTSTDSSGGGSETPTATIGVSAAGITQAGSPTAPVVATTATTETPAPSAPATVTTNPPAATNPPLTTATPAATAPPATNPPTAVNPAVTTTPPVGTTPAVATNPPVATSAPPVILPPGVPKDWPKDKPIPPMPPDCEQPQLELNGHWNCQ